MSKNPFPISTRVKLAAKSLAGLNFGDAALALTSPQLLNPSTYRQGEPFSNDGAWFFDRSGGRDIWFSWTNLESAVKAYQKCPPVTAIINKKAGAFNRGKNWILTTGGKGKGKESNSPAAEKLRKLLAQPNPLQSWKEFEAQMYIYVQLFGYCPILPIKPAGFPNIDATSLWIIPPTICTIEESWELWFQDGATLIKSIKVSYKGQTTYLNVNDVFIVRDISPSFSSQIIPESRLRSLEEPINNIIGAYNSRGALIDDRGALGIISSEKSDESGMVPLTAKEKQEVQEEFLKYGIKKSQFKYIITTAALKWTSVGYPTKDLMLFEEIEDDIMRICDSTGMPFRLMASIRNSSLGGSDAGDFHKQLYEDTILPEAERIYEQLNRFFNTTEYKITLDKDFSHLQVLQADAVKEATARFNRNKALEIEFRYDLITKNRWLVLNGEDPIGEEGEVYYSEIREQLGNPAQSAGGLNGDNNGNNGNNANQNQ